MKEANEEKTSSITAKYGSDIIFINVDEKDFDPVFKKLELVGFQDDKGMLEYYATITNIDKHCVSKQRVKDVIIDSVGCAELVVEILERLGLEIDDHERDCNKSEE